MSAQADQGGAGPAPARPAQTAVGRKAAPRRVDGGRRSSLAGGVLGLALLGACAGDPSPASLMVGGRLSAAFRDLAREEVQENFRLAPTLASAALAPRALRPLPVPVLRPRLAGALPPPPPPRKPVPDERIAWMPQAKPERRPAPESPVATRIAIWPPPWKPADLPLAVAPAAGPPEAPRHAIRPPPRKPDPADRPLALAPAAGPPEDPPRPDGPVPIVVAHGRAERPALDDGIAVSALDQLLPQLDRAAREALLADDPVTALAIYERLGARFPEERTVWLGRAVALERLGRGSEARALYQAMLGADPEDLGAKDRAARDRRRPRARRVAAAAAAARAPSSGRCPPARPDRIGAGPPGRPAGRARGAAPGGDSRSGQPRLTAAAAFVVMSHGENGLGAWLPSSLRKTTAGIPAHEDENADGAEPYVDKAQSQATGDEFDDLVVWREKGALAQAAGAVFSGPICTAADNLWTGYSCAAGSTADQCVAAGAVRSRCS